MKEEKKQSIWDMAMEGAKAEGVKPDRPKQIVSQKKKIDYGREIIMTFSNQKSLFSSKKIERFIVFFTFLILTVVYVALNIHEMESMEFIEVIGIWLAYGGYNSFMNLRDKKVDTNRQSVDDSEAS